MKLDEKCNASGELLRVWANVFIVFNKQMDLSRVDIFYERKKERRTFRVRLPVCL